MGGVGWRGSWLNSKPLALSARQHVTSTQPPRRPEIAHPTLNKPRATLHAGAARHARAGRPDPSKQHPNKRLLNWPSTQVRPDTPALDAMILMETRNISAVAVVAASGSIIANFSISELRWLLRWFVASVWCY